MGTALVIVVTYAESGAPVGAAEEAICTDGGGPVPERREEGPHTRENGSCCHPRRPCDAARWRGGTTPAKRREGGLHRTSAGEEGEMRGRTATWWRGGRATPLSLAGEEGGERRAGVGRSASHGV